MSLCLCIQKPNEIYISGDSRMSVSINNQKVRWHDNYCKVHQIDNMVIFVGGRADIMLTIIDKIKHSSNRSLEYLSNLAKTEYGKKYTINNTGRMVVAMLIATFENEPIVYFIGDGNNFEIMKIELGNKEYQDIFLGCSCDAAREVFNYSDFALDGFIDVVNAYQTLYEQVVAEEIGGELTVYRMAKNSIEKKTCTLKNPENIKQYQSWLTCSSLFIGDSQIDAVNNNKIDDAFVDLKASTINALNITAGSVSADWVYAGNIEADQINTTDLYAERIYESGTPANFLAIQHNGNNFGMGLYKGSELFFGVGDQDSSHVALYLDGQIIATINTSTHIVTPVGSWDFGNVAVTGLHAQWG